MKYAILGAGLLLGGCALLPTIDTTPTPAVMEQRQVDAMHQLQLRMQYSNWLLDSREQQRKQERQRLRGQRDVANKINLAMVNSHPDEARERRVAALDELELLLPEVGLDEQAYLRTWIALGRAHLKRSSSQSGEVTRLKARVKTLEAKIEQLSVIDEQINQRKLTSP
ncbi:hypothetical protein [Aeromonas simiae]|uniref:Lipoprotein n=1 Tax=Aeromonas simiae TaxID=218936 RepID=A0A5J6WWF7_9GAMM|nr:hypothetical protein [Aeromonas simiae]QFI53615.1 hypothetical protein FE240_02180 [Aeromonas simiae]